MIDIERAISTNRLLNFYNKESLNARVPFFLVLGPKLLLFGSNDELETFETCKYRPLTLPVVVEAKSRKILSLAVGQIAAKKVISLKKDV